MSVTFLVALAVALLAIMYWRIVLMIVAAILLAMLATGISTISSAVAGHGEQTTIVAPGEPGARAGEPQGVPERSDGSQEDPRAEGGHPS